MRLLRTSDTTFVEVPTGRPPRYAILSHRWAAPDQEVSYQDVLAAKKKDTTGWCKIVGFCAMARKHGYDHCWVDTCCIDKTNGAELSEAINSMFRWYRKAGVCFVYLADVDVGKSSRLKAIAQVHVRSRVCATAKVEAPWQVNALRRVNQCWRQIVRWPQYAHSILHASPDTNVLWRQHGLSQMNSFWQGNTLWQGNPLLKGNGLSVIHVLRLFGSLRQKEDVDEGAEPLGDSPPPPNRDQDIVHDSATLESEWFSRGWTLQELIAPDEVMFFDCNWTPLGTRSDHSRWISFKTKIAEEVLLGNCALNNCSIAEKFSWAASRKTSRPEDESYCLLGLLGVEMPLIYGEGRKAFLRLQETLLARTTDYTLLAWTRRPRIDGTYDSLLAPSIKRFMYGQRSSKYGPLMEYNTGRIRFTVSSGQVAIDIIGMDLDKPSWDDSTLRQIALPIAAIMEGDQMKFVTLHLKKIDRFAEWSFMFMDVMTYEELYPPTPDPVPLSVLQQSKRIYVGHKFEDALLGKRKTARPNRKGRVQRDRKPRNEKL